MFSHLSTNGLSFSQLSLLYYADECFRMYIIIGVTRYSHTARFCRMIVLSMTSSEFY